MTKKRYSAFYMTELDLLLNVLGTKEVVVSGVCTNFCVRATVVDAANRDLMPIVPSDCVASYTENEHLQSLADIQAGFGQVLTSDEVINQLSKL